MSLTIRSLLRCALAAASLAGGGASAQTPCWSGSHWNLPGSGIPAITSCLRVAGGSELQNPSGITLDVWFYAYAPHEGRLLSKGEAVDGDPERTYDVTLRADGHIAVDLSFDGAQHASDITMVTVGTVTTNAWHRVVVTYDAALGEARAYLDGVLHAVAIADVFGTLLKDQFLRQTQGPLHIGGAPGVPTKSFLGSIDEVRIWTRALSPAEIQQTGVGPLDGLPGLAASFHLDDSFLDLSGGHVATKIGSGAFGGKCASHGNYGPGIAGTAGVPPLTLDQPPVAGAVRTLQIGNPTGQSTAAILAVGTQPAALPVLGGLLVLQPSATAVLGIGPSGASLPFVVPSGANHLYYLQSFVADPGAPQGAAASRGLFLHVGK